ncbi:hypothetical protein O1M63_43575 [Streptomyces mirabilis]|nr:hypothetical protein [Streptomyces mirabilis]
MRTLAAIALAGAALSLAGPAHADGILDASAQKVLPTDIYKPTLPASEQDGVKFHNVDVVSFLPGVVDETWIVAFGGKKTHFGTNKTCFSLSGSNLQLSPDAVTTGKSAEKVEKVIACWGAIPDDILGSTTQKILPGVVKARCLSKDISGENKGSPEEEKKPLKEEKCPPRWR